MKQTECSCYQPHPNYGNIFDVNCRVHSKDGYQRWIITPQEKLELDVRDRVKLVNKYRWWLMKGRDYEWRISEDIPTGNTILERKI